MNINILTLISAVVVSTAWLFGAAKLPMFQCDPTEFGCTGTGIGIALIHFIVIPIILGILGAVFSRERRLRQACYSFGISFIVAILVFLPRFIAINNQNNMKAEQDILDMKAQYEANPEQYKQKPY